MSDSNKKNYQIILAGIGGQGILFTTKIISTAAMRTGFKVIGSETHGMSQRGGSVISHLKIGNFKGPLVRLGEADILFAFEGNELIRNLPFLNSNSNIILNANKSFEIPEKINKRLSSLEIDLHRIDANEIALELKSPLVANLAVLGYFANLDILPITYDEFSETIDILSPARFKKLNLDAFNRGASRSSL